ncbi:MAG: Fe-S protein assembly co-chaperone HscB [Alphaproteobacteria bacterium]|nr:Fe-S protein assembly co-chaperone HscB [Alphaproteobacteria bacterium]
MRRGAVVVVNHSMSENPKDPFQILGLEPTFDLDMTVLDEAYYARQELTHPDRFVYHSDPERQAASSQAALLNQAYETLKMPTLRAKVLLKLRGIDVKDDDTTAKDPVVLEEMLDLQEALAQATTSPDLSEIKDKIQDQLQSVMNSFSSAINLNHDHALPQLFLRLSYLSKLSADIKTRQRQSSLKRL